jgi:uncharacterized protein involved in exopolysaccharide biosynthesis
MTASQTANRYWRVLVVAAVGGVLAFSSSFLVTPTYESSTRLIIHGRDVGFMSSSGQTQTDQPNITDSSLAKALADTYGSVATSRSLATAVVDDLDLDAPAEGSGLFHTLSSGAAWLYRCSRAFIAAGFCADLDPRETAIASVQEGTTALQLGTTAGATAGQPGSYVLEITSSGESGEQARAITNAVADELVESSAALLQRSIEAYIVRLEAQLGTARDDVETRAAAVTAFETQHNVSAADQQMVVTATSYDDLRADLNTARADLADADAQLQSTTASLERTSATVNSDQQIDTGRSGTSITINEANPVYSDLLTQRSETLARITGLEARISVLEGQVAAGSPVALSGVLADLANLQADLGAVEDQRDELTASLADAQTQAATAAPDLTRIDEAGRPAYPVAPKRYLYLLMGLLLGGLAGGGLTWLAERRLAPAGGAGTGEGPDDEGPEDEDQPNRVSDLGTLGFDEDARSVPADVGSPGQERELPPVPAPRGVPVPQAPAP